MDNFENENNFTDKDETLEDQNQGSTPVFENPDLTAVPQEPEMPAFSQAPEAVEESAADPYNTEPQFSGFGQSSGQFSQFYAPPVYEAQQKIEFYNESVVNSDNKKKPASKGLKAFAAIMAVVLLMTVSCTVGYNLGRRKTTSKSLFGTTSMKVYPKPADTDEMTAQEVYDKLNDSIVGIIVYNEDGSASQASGVVYTDNEYILTNDHIYSTIGAPKFKVYTSKGEVLEAEYVAGDTISDLALIKVKNATGLKAPQYGDSSELKFGENVVAIGRPGDARTDSSISTGIISNPNRRAQVTSSYSVRMIQTDCDIFEGSSGGALVNMYGQVVGITSSKTTSDSGASMSFAIPVKTISRIAPQLSSKGKVVDRAKLGITYNEITALEAELNDSSYTGLYVTEISKDSDLYGKIEKGCIITHVNGKAITRSEIVLDIIDDSRAGDTIQLKIVSADGNSKDYSVKLKANVGESSYSKEKKETEETPSQKPSDDSNGKDFNFPKGE